MKVFAGTGEPQRADMTLDVFGDIKKTSQTGDGPGDFSHTIEVNSDDADGQSVSNYEYESRLQDKKRQIKLLDKAYLNTFVEEFERLVRR